MQRKLSKLISILLCAIMVIGIMPITSFAANPTQLRINKMPVDTITASTSFEQMSNYAKALIPNVPEGIDVGTPTIYDMTGSYVASQFEAGREYAIWFSFKAKPGYSIPDDFAVLYNGVAMPKYKSSDLGADADTSARVYGGYAVYKIMGSISHSVYIKLKNNITVGGTVLPSISLSKIPDMVNSTTLDEMKASANAAFAPYSSKLDYVMEYYNGSVTLDGHPGIKVKNLNNTSLINAGEELTPNKSYFLYGEFTAKTDIITKDFVVNYDGKPLTRCYLKEDLRENGGFFLYYKNVGEVRKIACIVAAKIVNNTNYNPEGDINITGLKAIVPGETPYDYSILKTNNKYYDIKEHIWHMRHPMGYWTEKESDGTLINNSTFKSDTNYYLYLRINLSKVNYVFDENVKVKVGGWELPNKKDGTIASGKSCYETKGNSVMVYIHTDVINHVHIYTDTFDEICNECGHTRSIFKIKTAQDYEAAKTNSANYEHYVICDNISKTGITGNPWVFSSNHSEYTIDLNTYDLPENIIHFKLPETDTTINLVNAYASGKRGQINGVKNSNIIYLTSDNDKGSHTLNVQNVIFNGIDTNVGGTHGGNTIFTTSLKDCALIVNNCDIRGFYEAFSGFSDYKISNTLIYNNYEKDGVCAPGHLICYQENEPEIREILGKNQQLLIKDLEGNWEEANGYEYPSYYGGAGFYKFEINTSLNISIDYEAEKLTGFTKGAYYYVDKSEGRAQETTKDIDPSWFGATIKLKRNCSDGTYPEKDLEIPARPVLTVNDFTIQAPSSSTAEDGRIKKKSHITAPLEYSKDNGTTWTRASNAGIGSLADGDSILVRQEAVKGKSFRGEILKITMHACSLKAHEAKAESCTEDGNIAYYECTTCGKLYKDADKSEEFTDISETLIKATGHNYSKKDYNKANLRTTAANCSEYSTYWYLCKNCDMNAKDDPTATNKYFLGTQGEHDYVKVDGKPATCREIGEKEHYKCSICQLLFNAPNALTDAESLKLDKLEHVVEDKWLDYGSNTMHVKVCKNCREVRVSEPHTGGTATCNKKAVCETCGIEYGEKNPSNHAGGTELVNKKDAVHKTQTKGYTGDTKCLGCNAILSTGADIAPTAHTPATAYTHNSTHHWKICTVDGCGVEITGSKETHSFEWIIDKPATASQKGSKHEECKVCHFKKAAVEIPVIIEDKPTEPTTKPTEPTTKPAEPTTKPTQPTTKPTEPTEKPTDPIADFLLGDVNGDGHVKANDARTALRAAAKLQELDERALKAADLDGNGKVTAAEARKILRFAAKLDKELG